MKSLLAVASLLVAALLLTGCTAQASGSDKEKALLKEQVLFQVQNDVAEALVRISYDPKQCLFNENLLNEYLNSPAVTSAATELLQKKGRDALKMSSRFSIQETVEAASEGQMLAKIKVWTPKYDPPVANDLLKLHLEHLRESLARSQESDAYRDNAYQLDHAVELAMFAREKLSRFVLDSGGVDLSRAAWSARSSAIQAEMEKVSMDLAGKKMRQNEVAEQVKRLTVESAAKAKDDPLLAELEKVVKLREEELAATKGLAKANVVSAAEVNACEVKVADARVELLKRKEASSAAGRESLAKLRDEEVTLSLDIGELEARLNQLLEARSRVADLFRASIQYEQLLQEKEMAERDHEQARQQHHEALRQREKVPTLSIVYMSP
jgi:hypothetical protein